jgi:hypothetical protein
MAPVLQCPECGTKHPLGEVPDAGSFPCKGCGRQLKVPEMAPRGAGAGAPGPARPVPPVNPNPTVAVPPVPPQSTRVMPVVEHNPAASAAPAAAAAPPAASAAPVAAARPVAASAFAPVPVWMRVLLWIVALPLSFVVVLLFARAIGVLTSNQITDIWLAPGSSRFWPVARLLPFVALLTAVLVQAGVMVLARRRGRPASRHPV